MAECACARKIQPITGRPKDLGPHHAGYCPMYLDAAAVPTEPLQYACGFQAITWDQNDHPDGVTLPCGQVAHHRFYLVISGFGSREEFYCCRHARQVEEELAEPTSGVRLGSWQIVRTQLSHRVFSHEGHWVYEVSVCTPGLPATLMPPVRLKSSTQAGARHEADAIMARLRKIADSPACAHEKKDH